MSKHNRKILVTCALTYANGPLHLGHMVEYIQADIWVRAQKMLGHTCVFIGGDDTHGTPVMLSAKQRGVTPEQLIKEIYVEHQQDLVDFHIELDNFYSTHSEENRQLAELIYGRLKTSGDITTQTISQAYDPKENMFLPDRYIKGECPRCGSADQYGDNCEVCGATYTPLELKNPVSVLSGVKPTEKNSLHYFFKLSKYTEFLQNWGSSENHLQPEVSNKLAEWFKEGLKDLDISRDAPYFGFKIPDTEDKYFYVWLDAPIGYISIFENLCKKRHDLDFADFWLPEGNTELYHFVGKDIINFHALMWPAMLEGASFRTPTAIFTHGYLTVNGAKMSKSRGTFIKARTYLEQLNPEYLRYYFAAKLNNHVEDLDLNLTDFVQRINADLVGKVVNIASRCASFIHKYFAGKLSVQLIQTGLLEDFANAGDAVAEYYNDREYSRAIRTIMELADRANQFIDSEKPWLMIKEADKQQHVQDVCSLGLNLFRLLMVYLKPVLPIMAKNSEEFLNVAPLTWHNRREFLRDHKINPFVPLAQRITPEQVAAIQQAT